MVTTESHEISFPPPTSPFASASASASASSSTHLSKHAADFDYDLTALNTSYHASYQPLTNVSSFSHTLASLHPELVSVSTYGYSYEGRPLEVVRIADQARNRTMGVRPVVVVGPMHAREVCLALPFLLGYEYMLTQVPFLVDRDRYINIPRAYPRHAIKHDRLAATHA
jgi:hypothetical protein